MKTFITCIVMVLALSSISLGQVQYGIYEFTGTSTGDNQFNAVTAQPYFGSFSTFTRTGVTWVSGANVFSSSNWGTAKDDNKYVRFTFTLTPPYNFNGIALKLGWAAKKIGGSHTGYLAVFYRFGSNSFADLIGIPVTLSTAAYIPWEWSIPSAPLNETFLEIRFYAYSASSFTLSLDNVKLTGSDFPLPVELSTFTVSSINKYIILNWQTLTETDNYGFDVERRTLNKDWEKISFVSGNGNSNSPKNYSYIDKTANAGKYTYRLKQIDANGGFSYSKEIEVESVTPTAFNLAQNYPNPFNPSTVISYQVPVQSSVQIDVFNSIGENVAALVNEIKEPGYYEVEFNASSLSSGIYFYTIKAGDFINVKKMVLTK